MPAYLSPRQHPYTSLIVFGAHEDLKLDCLIDTGFAGGVAIPRKLKERFDFPLVGKRTWELADGSEIELEVFAGRIKFEGKEKEIAILFVDGEEGMVGIEFLKGMRFVKASNWLNFITKNSFVKYDSH